MVLTLEGSERFDTNLEERAINIVEGEKADERSEGLTVGRDGPISYQIKLGFGWAVAIRGDVVADVLNAVGQKLAFLELESDSILHEDVADAGEQLQ